MRLNNSYKFFCIDQSRFYIFLHSRHLKIIYQNLKIFFSFLKELRNCNWKLFLCPPKKQAKTQPPFWTAIFLDKFTLAYQSNYLNIKRNKFISHKQYLLVFSSLKAQRGLTQTNVYHKFFYSVWKETIHQPSKVQQLRKTFSQVCMLLVQLPLKNLSLPWGSFQSPCSCVDWKTWFEISSYFNFSLHNIKLKYNANTKVPKWNSHIPYTKDIIERLWA